MRIINLLPKPKQEELHYEALYHSLLTAAVFGVVTMVAVVLLDVGLGVYLQNQEKAVSVQIEQVKKQTDKDENAQIKTVVDGINQQLKDYEELSKISPMWSQALRAFSADVPDGVKITSFIGDTAKKQIDIQGFADTREQTIDLYNRVNQDKDHFKDIDYPLENVSKPKDVTFHFTFFVQDQTLKDNQTP
jgi:Tfp pilus assembly protein PilN